MPRLGLRLGRQQLRDVDVVQPYIGGRLDQQVVGEGAREHDAVDSARRGARDHVDDDAQVEVMAAYGFQEIEIDLFGGVLGTVEPGGLVVVPRSLLVRGLLGIVVCAGGAYELQDLLGYPVLIDGE